jgi:hypothetical protein
VGNSIVADERDQAILVRDVEVNALYGDVESVYGTGLAVLGVVLPGDVHLLPWDAEGLADEQAFKESGSQAHAGVGDEHFRGDDVLLCGGDEGEGLSGSVGRPDVVALPDLAGVDEPCCYGRVTAAAGAGTVGRRGQTVHHHGAMSVDEHDCWRGEKRCL